MMFLLKLVKLCGMRPIDKTWLSFFLAKGKQAPQILPGESHFWTSLFSGRINKKSKESGIDDYEIINRSLRDEVLRLKEETD